MTPDPLGGDITNPQSLNRYAYAGNNPTSATDPSGLNCKVTDTCGTNQGAGYNDARPFYAGGCGMAFYPADCNSAWSGWPWNASQEMLAGLAQYLVNNCIGCVTFQGNLYGNHYSQTFASWDAYADWRATLASNPLNQINAAYALGCQYATNPCGNNDPASVRYVGSTYNVQLLNNPLDTSAAAADGYQDPAFFNALNHPGAAGSYYIGGGYVGIDAGHVADLGVAGLEAHYDSFAPYNPLHWIFEWLPSQFINTRPQAGGGIPYTCSVTTGCHP